MEELSLYTKPDTQQPQQIEASGNELAQATNGSVAPTQAETTPAETTTSTETPQLGIASENDDNGGEAELNVSLQKPRADESAAGQEKAGEATVNANSAGPSSSNPASSERQTSSQPDKVKDQ